MSGGKERVNAKGMQPSSPHPTEEKWEELLERKGGVHTAGHGTDTGPDSEGPQSRQNRRAEAECICAGCAGCGRAAAYGEQADLTVAVPAEMTGLLLAHGLDPADLALARFVVTALGVTKIAVAFSPPSLFPH